MSGFCNSAVRTTCPYCGVGCGVIATEKPDGSVRITGDPDHPANFGRLCSKGTALAETIGLEERLLHPQINGRRAGWDEALDLVAARFSEAISTHGPDSVAFYVSGQILTEDYYVANKFMKGFIGSANIDTNSRLCMASSVVGHKKAFGADTVPGTYEDLELAGLVVLVGSNLAWCHPVLYQRLEAAKQARPDMRVVLIDPRETMTAALADLHLQIRPDGDVALFCGLLSYLDRSRKLNKNYIHGYTTGFADALDAASLLDIKALSDLTGLCKASIRTFFEWFAETERTVTVYSQGVNQSSCGTDKVSAILNCHLATGRIGRPGMGPFSVTGQPNAMGGREVGGLATMLANHMDLDDPDHRDLVQSFWNSPLIANKPGLKAVDMFKAVDDGKIKAIWIMSTNPVDSMPDADRVRTALKNCPFVVVSDILEDTDTARLADVKLPAAAWGEKDGTVTNSERRISRQRAFLPVPGEAKPDWWHLAEVARRMGFVDGFQYAGPAEIFSEYAALSGRENDGTHDFDISGLASLSEAEYRALGPIQWPVRERRDRQDKRFFAQGNFYHRDGMAKFVPVKPFMEEERSVDGRLILNTGRIRDQWHTMTRTARATRLNAYIGEPFCDIHPDDAQKHSIADRELVVVKNDLGKVVLRARITSAQQPGHVFAPMHWTDQVSSRGRINALVPPVTDQFSGQPASKKIAVSVRSIGRMSYGFLAGRRKPDFSAHVFEYWALAKCSGGWRAEFAVPKDARADQILSYCYPIANGGEPVEYHDVNTGQIRQALFGQDRLECALYLAGNPVSLAREWLCEQLTVSHNSFADRMKVLAGKPGANAQNKGALVCACMDVGVHQISRALQDGNLTVSEIGQATAAGTNCGSCRTEINGMIDAYKGQIAIAAE